MPDSASFQGPFPDPPPVRDDAVAWGEWAVDFLGRFRQAWIVWQRTWTTREVPYYQTGNPDAFVILDRETRVIGMSSELVTGSPPPALSHAARLHNALSGAVQRLGSQALWKFETQKQADEVADALLAISQAIENAHYRNISEMKLGELCRMVTMAIRRGMTDEDSVSSSKAKHNKACGRPSLGAPKVQKREDLVKPSDWNELSDRQRNCLGAMLELGAVDADSRRDATAIASGAEGRDANAHGFKVPLADLVHQGLAVSRVGRKGGYWLTPLGRKLVAAEDPDSAAPGPTS